MTPAATGFGWLVDRPIAHRGLHDKAAGRFENTLSAARAAVAAGFAIECDVQRSSDGEAMVFHDFSLDRLAGAGGSVGNRSAQALAGLSIGGSADCIPRLAALLDVVSGRVPLIVEIKSAFDGDLRLAGRVGEVIVSYAGPLALKSFDPDVLSFFRGNLGHGIPLGIVAEATYRDPEWSLLDPRSKSRLAALAHFTDTDPDFLSYAVDDLPHAAATLFRAGLRRPVMTWTVRNSVQREKAAAWADQMVFEGFVP